MGKRGEFSGTFNSDSGQKLNVNLPIIFFKEDNSNIAYCPALDVSGYGKDEDEAYKSFMMALGEFFNYTIHKNTFRSVLTEMGWELKKSKHKPMHPPSISKSLETNDNFSRIFNSFPFHKVDRSIPIPAMA